MSNLTITNELYPDPLNALIVIDGLFILSAEHEKQQAQLGIYEYANGHFLRMRIAEKPNPVDLNDIGRGGELIRNLDQDDELKEGHVSIDILDKEPFLQVYQNTELHDHHFSANFGNKDQTKDFKDFRWIVDFDGPRFHNRPFNLNEGIINRNVIFRHGTISAADISERVVQPMYPEANKLALADLMKTTRENVGVSGNELAALRAKFERLSEQSRTRDLYVANKLAISIGGLETKNKIIVNYGITGPGNVFEERERRYALDPKPGTYYEIYLTNNCYRRTPDPLKEEDPDKKDVLIHSDIQYYYNVIDVPVHERLDLRLPEEQVGAGNNRIPCDLIYLGNIS